MKTFFSRSLLAVIFTSLFLLSTHTANAGNLIWSAPEQASDIGGQNQTRISIAIDSKGTVHSVWESGQLQINYAYKVQGDSWSVPIILSSTASRYPKLIIDNQDNIHVVWQGLGSQYLGFKTYYVSKSPEGNWTFESPNPLPWLGTFPSVAIDNNGTKHLIWVSIVDGKISYSNKTTNGLWSTPTSINPAGAAQETSLAIDQVGNLYVAWDVRYDDSNYNHFYTIMFSQKLAGENSWSDPISLIQDLVPNRAAYNPKIVTDKLGNVHVVWGGEDSTGYSATYYAKREANGIWRTPLVVGKGSHPSIAVDTENNLHLAYDDNASYYPPRIDYRFKPFNLDQWSEPVPVSRADSYANPFVDIAIDSSGFPRVMWFGESWLLGHAPPDNLFYLYYSFA